MKEPPQINNKNVTSQMSERENPARHRHVNITQPPRVQTEVHEDEILLCIPLGKILILPIPCVGEDVKERQLKVTHGGSVNRHKTFWRPIWHYL